MTTKRKRYSTIHERIAGIKRQLAAVGRAVAEDDPDLFAELVDLQDALAGAIDTAVIGLRRDHTWQSIGDALGITRQACVIRWGHLAREAGYLGPRNRPDSDS